MKDCAGIIMTVYSIWFEATGIELALFINQFITFNYYLVFVAQLKIDFFSPLRPTHILTLNLNALKYLIILILYWAHINFVLLWLDGKQAFKLFN